ncbi:MAG: phosphoribosylformylglycinamidine synthase subunit PurQ [Candidatus Omnitrophica bacterium]|nr:phosphoribosylformylglycinamidine synthase subunit PurQ [Candidatus Omnitrophota bacterium]
MKSAVVVFPGSNCDTDCQHLVQNVLRWPTTMVWHGDRSLNGADLVVLPGGFSYGDYLRTGAMASLSPILGAVKEHAARGGLVIGICNGFQILIEAGLLPGALLPNKDLKFICREVSVRVETVRSPFTAACKKGQVLNMPIAHHEGNYFADKGTLESLHKNDQICFRYCDAQGKLTEDANPNGSMESIAGICNKEGNVLGLMPHPERMAETILGGTDGKTLFRGL